VLVSILMEYRSAEMLLAVRTLWDFYRANPDTFVEVYESRTNEGVAPGAPAGKMVTAPRGAPP
jgi:hypothetical protein